MSLFHSFMVSFGLMCVIFGFVGMVCVLSSLFVLLVL